jgi:predicted MFS family arabinose efflux permease
MLGRVSAGTRTVGIGAAALGALAGGAIARQWSLTAPTVAAASLLVLAAALFTLADRRPR